MGVLGLALITGGCGKKTTQDFGYDVEKYVTLGEYTGIEYTPEATEVTEEEIEARIQDDLEAKSKKEEVTDRAVKEGDIVNIDYKGLKDGVAFEGGTAEGYDLEIGSGTFIDGFEEQLIGLKIGDNKEINVTFPEKYQKEDLAGQPVVFEIKINAISVNIIPELTEENVKELMDYDNIAAYKAAIKEEMEQEIKETAEDKNKANIWNKVIENSEIKEYPEEEVDKAVTQLKKQYEEYAKANGATLEQLMELFGMTEEQFNEEMNSYGKETVAEKLVYQAIALKENIYVSDKEYEEKLSEYVEEYGFPSKEKLIENYGEEVVKSTMLRDKVVDFVISKAVAKK